MQANAPAPDRDSLQGYPIADPIRAELSGNNSCTALGIAVRAKAPVLALCRKLIAAGHDPGRPLHAYRGETLALTVTAIGYGAKYTVVENRQFGPILLRLAPKMMATLSSVQESAHERVPTIADTPRERVYELSRSMEDNYPPSTRTTASSCNPVALLELPSHDATKGNGMTSKATCRNHRTKWRNALGGLQRRVAAGLLSLGTWTRTVRRWN